MIRKATPKDLDALDILSQKAIADMHARGIFQWPKSYPRKAHFAKDIDDDALYVLEQNNRIIGAMAYYEENDPPYRTVSWFRDKSMVIHRILVDPAMQQSGAASTLMRYAIKHAHENGYESIKIDTPPGNTRMRHFLKRHQFIEGQYIKPMHRIAFERTIEKGRMDRIMILGSPGTGKTTLGRMLSEKLGIPALLLDTVYWQRNWQSLSKDEFAARVRAFLRSHDRYVTEGNYTGSVTFLERMQLADTIIILDYSPQVALKGIIEREAKYKHRYRSDMASGCIEEVDQEFLKFVMQFDSKRRKMIAHANRHSGYKHVLRFTKREDMMRWFDTL